jgi:type I restriction enzyme, R subunit
MASKKPSKLGAQFRVINAFGGKAGFEKAVHEMQSALYQEIA